MTSVFLKVDGFEPCVHCDKPTCYTIDGVRTHRGCHSVHLATAPAASSMAP